MTRLIDADALKKVFENLASDDYNVPIWYQQTVFETIDNAPTVDTDLSKYSDKLWEKAYERGKNERPHGERRQTTMETEKECQHCCGGDNPKWEWDEIPFDMGIFGEAQISLAITNRGAEIQLERTGSEECTYVYERLPIKYCPYCGRELGGRQ